MTTHKLKRIPSSTMKAKAVTRLVGQVVAGDGITVVKAAGVFTVSLNAGTGVFQLADADLTAIAALTGTGLLRRTTLNTWTLGTTVLVPEGGTGIASYTRGDLLAAFNSTSLFQLSDVATGSVLVSGGIGEPPVYSATPTITTLAANTSVFIGTGSFPNAAGILDVRGTTTSLGLNVLPHGPTSATRQFWVNPSVNANRPLDFVWGTDGDPWITPSAGGVAAQIYMYSRAALGTGDPTNWGLYMDRVGISGTEGSMAGALISAELAGTWTSGGNPLAGVLGLGVRGASSRGAAVTGQTIAAILTTTNGGSLQGLEIDIQSYASNTGKQAIQIVDFESGATTATSFITDHASETFQVNYAINIRNFTGYGWHTAIQTSSLEGSAFPVRTDGYLWTAGGGTVAIGLNWPWMTFGSGFWALVPSGAYLAAKNASGSANLKILGLSNPGNLIEIGTGATVDPTGGGAVFGSSTLTNININGTAGSGWLQLVSQASAPGAPTSSARLYTDASNRLAFKTPDATDTLVGKATTDVLTNKTFNSAGTGNVLQVSGVTVSRGQFPGTNTNDNAAAGNIREYVSASTADTGLAQLSSTVTVTIASPAVVTWGTTIPFAFANNVGAAVVNFTTDGALPTGIVAGTNYYVIGSSVSGNTFQIATSADNAIAGTAINTSGTQSGTHTGIPTGILVDNIALNITAISLTAGDWEVTTNIAHFLGASTSITVLQAGISTASNLISNIPGRMFQLQTAATVPGASNNIFGVGPTRLSLSATTTVYAIAKGRFTVSTDAGWGGISARRV